MIYLNSPSTDPKFNLALEQYVFEEMDKGQEYFMLWQNANTIVVGKNQNTFEEINHKKVEEKDVTVVRRLSGGGAVYHDMGNLNFTFIMDAKNTSELDIHLFCQPVADLLQKLSVPAEVNGRNDILIEGRKFSGNSQYLRKGRVMHHGTIMFESDLETVAEVLNVAGEKFQSKATKSVRSRVTNIKPYVGDMTLPEFKKSLISYILEDKIEEYTLTEADIKRIEEIKKERYELWEWNYGKSANYAMQESCRIEGFGKIEVKMNVEDAKISELVIFGDFFGSFDLDDIVGALVGVELKEDEIKKALQPFDIGKYFHNLEGEQFVQILLGKYETA
ncbi:MAG: lipoate--protein ligase [Bacillota bacterium]